jgi:cyclophilin family peptidyl-prolyl cis-trans isomerase
MNQRLPSNRSERRRRTSQIPLDRSRQDLPAVIRFITNPKVFALMGVVFLVALVLGLMVGGLIQGASTNPSGSRQMNEAEDKPVDQPAASSGPDVVPTVAVKRYTAPPPTVIEAGKTYTATIRTSKGDIKLTLDPAAAPAAVNAFVFLAQDGYYNNTPFMQVTKNPDGSRFTAQAGDPTHTGLGTPGFEIKREATQRPFVKGAVGLDKGQFFISYGDYPSLTGRYAIIGQVTAGMDVLEKLSLLDLTSRSSDASGDLVLQVVVDSN